MLIGDSAACVKILLGLATHRSALDDLTSEKGGLALQRWDTFFMAAEKPDPKHVSLLDGIILSQFILVEALRNMCSMIGAFRGLIAEHTLAMTRKATSCCPQWQGHEEDMFTNVALLHTLITNPR